MAKKWIGRAVENSHGQFKAKAEAAGKSTKEFASEHEGSKGTLGKQGRLATALMGMNHKGVDKPKHRPAKEIRSRLYGEK